MSVFYTVGKYGMGPGQLWNTSGISVSVDHFAGNRQGLLMFICNS